MRYMSELQTKEFGKGMTPIDRAGQPAELAPGFVFLADNSGVLSHFIVAFQTRRASHFHCGLPDHDSFAPYLHMWAAWSLASQHGNCQCEDGCCCLRLNMGMKLIGI